MEIKITRKQELYKQCSDMVSNYYYLIYGRIINNDNSKYKKFRFIIKFDGYDLADYFEEEKVNISLYLDILIEGFISAINSYEDTDYFYNMCINSIQQYNEMAKNSLFACEI